MSCLGFFFPLREVWFVGVGLEELFELYCSWATSLRGSTRIACGGRNWAASHTGVARRNAKSYLSPAAAREACAAHPSSQQAGPFTVFFFSISLFLSIFLFYFLFFSVLFSFFSSSYLSFVYDFKKYSDFQNVQIQKKFRLKIVQMENCSNLKAVQI